MAYNNNNNYSHNKQGDVPVVPAQFLPDDTDDNNTNGTSPYVTIPSESMTPVPLPDYTATATVPASVVSPQQQQQQQPPHQLISPQQQQQPQPQPRRGNGTTACWIIGGSIACTAGVCCCIVCIVPLAIWLMVWLVMWWDESESSDFNTSDPFSDDFYNNNN